MLNRYCACVILALLGVTVAGQASAARCSADSISSGGFETRSGVRIVGVVGGIEAGTVEVRHGATVLAIGDLVEGAFAIDLPAAAPEQMLELRVRGRADRQQEFVELAGHLGTLAQLGDEGDPDGITRVGRVPTLAVSPESTARWSLVREQLDEPKQLAHECQLAQLVAQVDPAEVLRRAAVVQILIADGGTVAGKARPKAEGSTTLDIISDPLQLEAMVDAIEQDSPGRLAALVDVLAEPLCGYFDGDTGLVYQQRMFGLAMNTISGDLLRPAEPGTGRHINNGGADPYLVSCDGDVADLELAGERYFEGFEDRTVEGQTQTVLARYYTQRIRLSRVASDETGMVVANYQEWVTVFPFNPTLPDEHRFGEFPMLLVRKALSAPLDVDLVPGEYLAPTSGVAVVGGQANRLQLLAGGSGTDLDSGLPLQWAIDASGRLAIDFLDAEAAVQRTALIIPLRDESPHTHDTLTLVDVNGGQELADVNLLLKKQAGPHWLDDASVPGFYLQVAGRVGASSNRFFWELRADRSAPAYSLSDDSEALNFTYYWSRPGEGEIVLRRCIAGGVEQVILDREPELGECTGSYRRRTWTLYSVNASCYYLHEVQYIWLGVDPASGAPPNGVTIDRAYFYSRPVDRPLPPAGQPFPAGC